MEKQIVMEKEFIQYTEALALKELGFDEPCLGYYDEGGNLYTEMVEVLKAPLYQQAFRFFREKYNLYGIPVSNSFNKWKYRITSLDGSIILEHGCDQKYWIMGGFSYTYEETELACLKKLIEIIKEKL
jgi:hypothetical protein